MKLPASRLVKLERLGEQIVEVQRTQCFQAGAVVLIQRAVQPRVRRGRAALDARDRPQQAPGIPFFSMNAQHLFRDRQCLALRNKAHIAQQFQTDRVESADGHAPHRALAAQPLFQPGSHFSGGLIGKGDGGDLVRPHAALLYQMGDARNQRFGFAGARSRHDCDNSLLRAHRRLLFRVQCLRGGVGGNFFRRGFHFGQRVLLDYGVRLDGLHAKQRNLSLILLNFIGREQRDRAVFAVKARAALYLSRTQAADALGHTRSRDRCNIRNGCFAQHGEFAPQFGEQTLILRERLFRSWGHTGRGRDRLRQGCKAFKRLCALRAESCRTVGQFFHAMLHADGQLFAAYRTQTAAHGAFTRRQAHAAAAVTVQMVLPLLGEKLDRAGKSLSRADGAHERRVIALSLDQIGFPSQLRRRVRIRMRDQRQPV